MFFLVASYVLIIAGFILVYVRKKLKKEDPGLKVANIMAIKKTDGNYELTVKYSIDGGITFITDTICTKRKKHIGEDIIIQISEDEHVQLYKGDKIILFTAMTCWILGMLILCLFCK